MTDSVDLPAFSSTIVDRFWRYVDRGSMLECWLWTGYTTRRRGGRGRKNGRGAREGRIRAGGAKGRMLRATRVSLAIATGEWFEHLEVCHTCDNTLCVNPAHLYWGTHKENMADMAERDGGIGCNRDDSAGRTP